jgi:tagaturonate reductase
MEKKNEVPPAIAFGMACFLLFQHPEVDPSHTDRPTDDAVADWGDRWAEVDRTDAVQVRRFVAAVCADEALWGTRLDDLPGFVDALAEHLLRVAQDGVAAALRAHLQTVEG